jgi:hypothetical protein
MANEAEPCPQCGALPIDQAAHAPALTDALKDEREVQPTPKREKAAFEREWAKRYPGTEGRDWMAAKAAAQVMWDAAWQARASASGLSRPGEGDWVPTHRHYKGGLYQLLYEAHNEGNPSNMLAVYRGEDMKVWVRPLMMFNGVVELEHGEEIRRFQPLAATPARSTAPSVGLTEEEQQTVVWSRNLVENADAVPPGWVETLLAIIARAFPDSTKETKS